VALLSAKIEEKIAVTFVSEKLARLKKAKELYESDIGKKIEIDDFLDMLVKTYMSYRDKRGSSESSLLQKLTGQ
jgi:hypothetical protein